MDENNDQKQQNVDDNVAKFDKTKLGLCDLHFSVVFLLKTKCIAYNTINNITEDLDSIYHNYFYVKDWKLLYYQRISFKNIISFQISLI